MTNAKHGPTLDDMVLENSASGVGFAAAMEKAIDQIHVPTKDNKPDADGLIKHVMHQAGELAAQYMKTNPKYDPRSLPGYEALQNALETTPGAIENGHLTPKGKNALSNLYNSHVENHTVENGQISFQAAAPDDSKGGANSLAARVSEKYLKPLLDAARDSTQVASRIRSAIASAYAKARQWEATHNDYAKGFVPAYTPAPAR